MPLLLVKTRPRLGEEKDVVFIQTERLQQDPALFSKESVGNLPQDRLKLPSISVHHRAG